MPAFPNPTRTGTAQAFHLGSMTHAQLLANYPAAQWQNFTANVTDYGVSLVLISDGVDWICRGMQTLGRLTTDSAAPADALENTLASFAMPPKVLGLNGSLWLESDWVCTGSTNSKTFRMKVGATTIFGDNTASATVVSMKLISRVHVRGSYTNQGYHDPQIGERMYGSATRAYGSTAVNLTAATTISFTGIKATAGESLILKSVHVRGAA